MALFGGQRDISLFRTLNRELINDLVDTEVDIFKTSVYDVNDNLYGEAINKIYKKGPNPTQKFFYPFHNFYCKKFLTYY